MSIEAQPKSSPTWLGRANWRVIAYWFFTVLVAYENLAGFIWSVLRIDYISVTVTHLGYPLYFVNIVGTFQLACALALLAPRFPVLKEWAYVGAFIKAGRGAQGAGAPDQPSYGGGTAA